MQQLIVIIAVCLVGLNLSHAGDFEFEKAADRIVVRTDGKRVTEYLFKERRPCFFPVIGSSGRHMTRQWPLNPDSGVPESTDHPHQSGLWFAHGSVRNAAAETPSDFWHNETIELQEFIAFESNAMKDRFVSRNVWKSADGADLCQDLRTVSFGKDVDSIWIDFEITIIAPVDKDLILGDTKEGTYGLRVPEALSMVANDKDLRHISKGNIILSNGVSGLEAWGKRAKWCAIVGDLENMPAVIAMFDHPDNPRHPTWWIARPYGLFAANAFGISFFENRPKGTGDMVISAGENVTFRWRLVFLDSKFKHQDLENRYASFIR